MLPTNGHLLRSTRRHSHVCNANGRAAIPQGQPATRNRRTRDAASSHNERSTPTDDVPSWKSQSSRPHGLPESSKSASQASSSSESRPASSARNNSSSVGFVSEAPAHPKPVAKLKPANRQRQPREIAARKNPELYALAQPSTASQSQSSQTFSRQRAATSSTPQWEPQQTAGLAIPWLPNTVGSVVGSTGSFGPAAVAGVAPAAGNGAGHQHHQQQDSSSSIEGGGSCGVRLTNRPSLKPEVLAPAGGWPQLRAAVENGADAVYFGVTGFNARARAANFEPSELPDVMAYLHERGVKGYVALNILVFDEELPRLEELVRKLASSGVDAVIVQDVGAVALIRKVAPSLPIHGSTQMSITTAEGAEFAASLGVARVVVGRELSIKEIASLSSNTDVEVEAFCHGALCVSYSGQCYSSEAWGGRSANRGQCAQACRMPYGLIVDGQIKDLADISYLLSPQDLMALEQVPAMIAAGVGCFKIEGRLKGPEYVAATTAAYRAGVDAAWEQLLLEEQQHQERLDSNSTASSSSSTGSSSSRHALDRALVRNLAQVFSRGQDDSFNGLTPGFLEGSQHQRLVRGRAPRHRGLCLGRVTAITDRGVVVEGLLNPVKRGDGLVFDQGRPEQQEEGGSVWDVSQVSQQPNPESRNPDRFEAARIDGRGASSSAKGRASKSNVRGSRGGSKKVDGEARVGSSVELIFGPGQVNLRRLSVGDLVWKSRDPALESQLRDSYESVSSTSSRKLPVQVFVSGSLGKPLQLTLTDPQGNTVAADTGDAVLQAASKRPLSEDDVISGVGQLGDNSLAPSLVDVSGLELGQGLFLPASAFKAVRRAAADKLLAIRQNIAYDQHMPQEPVLPHMLAAAAAAEAAAGSQQQHAPKLRVLCRTPGQVEAALQLPWLDEIILDFLEVHGLREAVAAVQAAGRQAVVAMPRILKPDESRLLWFYLRLEADALLLRGAGCLQQLSELGGPGGVVKGRGALDGGKHLDDSSSSSGGGTSDGSSVRSNSSSSSSSNCTGDASSGSSGTADGDSSSSEGSTTLGAASEEEQDVTIPRLEGDFSLNAANVLAADLLLSQGLSRLCPTHDLNAAQLADLASAIGVGGRAGQLEMIVHQHLPIFHTEHCVFCRFLSKGNSYLDCGHPCERHTVQLRDNAGHDHLVLADMGCRNTVFNAAAQSGVYYMPRLAAAGYGVFRVELVDEAPHMVADLLEGYRAVLEGRRKPAAVWDWLRASSKGGVGAGSLEVKTERAVASLRPTARRH